MTYGALADPEKLEERAFNNFSPLGEGTHVLAKNRTGKTSDRSLPRITRFQFFFSGNEKTREMFKK